MFLFVRSRRPFVLFNRAPCRFVQSFAHPFRFATKSGGEEIDESPYLRRHEPRIGVNGVDRRYGRIGCEVCKQRHEAARLKIGADQPFGQQDNARPYPGRLGKESPVVAVEATAGLDLQLLSARAEMPKVVAGA